MRWVALAVLVAAAPAKNAEPDLIAALLRKSAVPAVSESANRGTTAPPADDAPLDAVLAYWRYQEDHDARPSPRLRARLLDACERDPALLPDLLRVLPEADADRDRIKTIWDRHHAGLGETWSDTVMYFLMAHSRYFRDELEKAAAGAHDEDGYVQGRERLEDLARLDWARAEPLLRRLASDERQPRRAALALAITYKHAVATGGAGAADLRKTLEGIATGRRKAGAARDTAVGALLATDWPGRDDWFLAMFADPTLRELHDGSQMFSPLEEPVARDPDKWIPVVTRLLGNRRRAVHDMAVTCLVQFQLKTARADALRPLLPWLANPGWSSASDRLRLIQSVDDLDLKEAVPGLIAVLGQTPSAAHDRYERSYAADALAHFKDARAVPAIRRAMAGEKDWEHLRRYYKGLLACGGVTPDQAAAALEAAARHLGGLDARASEEAALGLGDKVSAGPTVSLGLHLARGPAPEEPVIERLVARGRALERTEPATARALRVMLDEWQSRAGDRDLVQRLGAGTVSAQTVWLALAKRASLRANAGAELQPIAGRGDRWAAVAATVLGDKKIMATLLDGKDADAQAMVLACARLVSDGLPRERVAALLQSREGHVHDAAEAYLRGDDGPEARRALLAAAAGQAMIIGQRTPGDPGHVSFPAFDKIEEAMRRSVREPGGPEEILALLSAGYWGDAGQIIVRVKGGKGRLEFATDPARLFERDLVAAELDGLRAFLSAKKVDALGPLDTGADDGMQYEFVRVTPAGGRRVFMNNPDLAAGNPYISLCETFRALLAKPGLALRYRMAQDLPGLEILAADPAWQVVGVRLDGPQALIEVEPRPPRGARELAFPATARINRPPPPKDASRDPVWIAWPSGETVDAAGLARLSLTHPPLPNDLAPDLNRHVWATQRDGAVYVAAEIDHKDGLWRLATGRPPALVAAGAFASPLLSRDGRWLLAAARGGKTWMGPNKVVRVDTRSGAVRAVAIPGADEVDPVVVTPEGVLVERASADADALPAGTKITGPAKPEHFVVDPATGRARKVEGDFDPLAWESAHVFQSAGGDRIWALEWDDAMQASLLGQYDLRRFAFAPMMELRGLQVGSGDIWVDEPAGRVYAVYRGHLLRFPLKR